MCKLSPGLSGVFVEVAIYRHAADFSEPNIIKFVDGVSGSALWIMRPQTHCRQRVEEGNYADGLSSAPPLWLLPFDRAKLFSQAFHFLTDFGVGVTSKKNLDLHNLRSRIVDVSARQFDCIGKTRITRERIERFLHLASVSAM